MVQRLLGRARTTKGCGVGTKSVAGPKVATKIFSGRVVLKIQYKLNFELMYSKLSLKRPVLLNDLV
jgi:hypothetical protein